MSTVILYNGPIYTLDPAQPRVQALAVRDGRVLAVGSEGKVQAATGGRAEGINLHGRAVIPALTDAHVHFTMPWPDAARGPPGGRGRSRGRAQERRGRRRRAARGCLAARHRLGPFALGRALAHRRHARPDLARPAGDPDAQGRPLGLGQQPRAGARRHRRRHARPARRQHPARKEARHRHPARDRHRPGAQPSCPRRPRPSGWRPSATRRSRRIPMA